MSGKQVSKKEIPKYTHKLIYIDGFMKFIPVKKSKKKKEDCTACGGYGYFPRLFENSVKCPHCDENGKC